MASPSASSTADYSSRGLRSRLPHSTRPTSSSVSEAQPSLSLEEQRLITQAANDRFLTAMQDIRNEQINKMRTLQDVMLSDHPEYKLSQSRETSRRKKDDVDWPRGIPRTDQIGAMLKPPQQEFRRLNMSSMANRPKVLVALLTLMSVILSVFGVTFATFQILIGDSRARFGWGSSFTPSKRSTKIFQFASILAQCTFLPQLMYSIFGVQGNLIFGFMNLCGGLFYTARWFNHEGVHQSLYQWALCLISIIQGGISIRMAGEYTIQRYGFPPWGVHIPAYITAILPKLIALFVIFKIEITTSTHLYCQVICILISVIGAFFIVKMLFVVQSAGESLLSEQFYKTNFQKAKLSGLSFKEFLRIKDLYFFILVLSSALIFHYFWFANIMNISRTGEWSLSQREAILYFFIADILGEFILPVIVPDLVCCESFTRVHLLLCCSFGVWMTHGLLYLNLLPSKYLVSLVILSVLLFALIIKTVIGVFRICFDNYYLLVYVNICHFFSIVGALLVTAIKDYYSYRQFVGTIFFLSCVLLISTLAIYILYYSKEYDSVGNPKVLFLAAVDFRCVVITDIPTVCIYQWNLRPRDLEMVHYMYYDLNTPRPLPYEIILLEQNLKKQEFKRAREEMSKRNVQEAKRDQSRGRSINPHTPKERKRQTSRGVKATS